VYRELVLPFHVININIKAGCSLAYIVDEDVNLGATLYDLLDSVADCVVGLDVYHFIANVHTRRLSLDTI